MKTKILIAIASLTLLSGCKNTQSIDQNAFSTQSNISQSAIAESQSLDKASYLGLEHVFGDTASIQSDGKFVLLVFGKNNCQWCDLLKEDIKANYNIQEAILKNFKAYYINLSYSKIHRLNFDGNESQKETAQLGNLYNIRPTPTSVFLDSQGNPAFVLPGYLSPKQMELILDFVATRDYTDPDKKQKLLKILERG